MKLLLYALSPRPLQQQLRVGTTTRTHLFCRPPFPLKGEGPGLGLAR